MSSTDQIYMLCRELSDKIGELGSSEQRTSYAHTLRELLSIAEKQLSEYAAYLSELSSYEVE
jgi:hypothetical protein